MIKKVLFTIQCLLIILWLYILKYTDSFYSIYIICAFLAFVSTYFIYKYNSEKLENREIVAIIIISILFTIAIIGSNYLIFEGKNILISIIMGIISLDISIIVNIYIFKLLNKYTNQKKEEEYYINPKMIFLFSFCIIILIDLLYLFCIAYPGNISADSISQINQIMSGKYLNHHPYWHTCILKIMINLGLILFNNMNAAIATFCVFQIIFMALCFSFIIISVFELTYSLRKTFFVFVWFAIMPFNICYSCTLWKDVMFAGVVSVFITVLLRILRNIGDIKLNYILLFLSGVGFGVFRSNGWIALVLTFIVMLIFLRKKESVTLLILISVITITAIMKGPFVNIIGVQKSEFAESLSIPIQQISRVIYDGYEIDESQNKLIENIIDINIIKENYLPYISDPVKGVINNTEGSNQYLEKHKLEYLQLWIQLGLKYPKEFLKAWIDQTKGYWNGGYDYWVWITGIDANVGYGIHRIINIPILEVISNYYFGFFKLPFVNTFISIGFNVWLTIFSLIYSISQKKKEAVCIIPIVAIWFTLLVASPVFCEFRYIYPLFLSLPLILGIPFLSE